jgi:hypothetical protein
LETKSGAHAEEVVAGLKAAGYRVEPKPPA